MPQSPRPRFIVGDQVTIVGDGRTIYRITYIYRNRREVNLALPKTSFERFHVPMADLNTILATTHHRATSSRPIRSTRKELL